MKSNHAIRGSLVVLALVVVGLAACVDSDEPIIITPAGGELFDRYVALGNSITAGFQSGGLHFEMQAEAYPVLLAEKAGASFGIPALRKPGCPPPLDGPLGQRISDAACNLRSLSPPRLVQNLAVPGAATTHLADPIGTGTTLNTLILGGRTQLGAMMDADPALVSVWIGNNDALGAALYGDLDRLTPQDAFETTYDGIVASLLETDAQDVILIGVVQAAAAAPALQVGAYFYAMGQSPPPGIPPLDVNDNCSPVMPDGATPNPSGFHLVSFLGLQAQLEAGISPIVVDCEADAFVLDQLEQAVVAARVAAFNAAIEARADANGWLYIDPSSAFVTSALSDPDKIRKCQYIGAPDMTFIEAVLASCPVDLDPTTEETFFGSYVSFDGVHPSALAHEVIADFLADALNERHGLGL